MVCVVLNKIKISRTVHSLVKCKSPGDLLKLSAIELQYSLKFLNISVFWEELLALSGILSNSKHFGYVFKNICDRMWNVYSYIPLYFCGILWTLWEWLLFQAANFLLIANSVFVFLPTVSLIPVACNTSYVYFLEHILRTHLFSASVLWKSHCVAHCLRSWNQCLRLSFILLACGCCKALPCVLISVGLELFSSEWYDAVFRF